MILLAILIFLVSVFEIWRMTKRKLYKERVVVIVIAVLSFSLGYFYLSDTHNRSLAQIIFSLMGKEF